MQILPLLTDCQLHQHSWYQQFCPHIYNGNRTEWSPIRSVIIRVINEIGRPRSGSPICSITSMITDQIGRHEVLLPVNHIYNKISKRKGRKRTGEGIDNSFTIRKKDLFKCNWSISAHALMRTVQLLRHDAYTVQLHCPNCHINAQIMAGDSQSHSRILL